ncbi:MAG: TonB-dependent receptor plug domain-containing protein [Gilvibacter sp.]
MKQNKGKAQLFLLTTFFWLTTVAQIFGQQTQRYQATAYLDALETLFDVRMSYASQDVQGVSFDAQKPVTLAQAIDFINSDKTPLQINQLSERYYTVALKEKSNDIICLQVVDVESGFPLANATLRLLDANADFGTLTNAQGKAFIPANYGGQDIVISFLGYAPVTLILDETTSGCEIILLSKEINELDIVLLGNIFTQGIYRGKDGSFKFTTEDFGLLPGVVEADVLQIAQVLPGVESIDETSSNINIRGGTNSENLILWDGIRMYQSGHFFGLISAFNPYITKDVSVYKNGTNSRYGESVSGVIDMQAENSVATNFNGKATLNLLHANAFVNIPITSNFSLLLAGRRSLNDLYQTPIYASYSERVFQDTEITNVLTSDTQSSISADEDFTFFDFTAKALWDFSNKDKLRFSFLLIDNALQFTERITTASFEITETSNLEQESMGAGFSWAHQYNERWSSTLQGYSSKYSLDSRNLDLFTSQDEQQRNDLLENSVRLSIDFTLSNKLSFEGGYALTETGVTNEEITNEPEFRRLKKDVLVSHNVFAQMSLSAFKNKTWITGGTRFVHYPKLNRYRAEPRLSLHQKLGGGFALEFLAELKSQATTQSVGFNSDFLGVENRRWALADDDQIPLIRSRQSSLGLLFTKNNWLINAELFTKKVKGITAQSQGFQNQYEQVIANGSYSVKGLELVINKQWNQFGGWLSYTYMKNDYEFDTLVTQEFANNIDIRHAFKGALSYQIDRLSLVLGIQWRRGKPFTTPLNPNVVLTTNDETIRYGAPNANYLSSFIRTDFSVKYVLIKREGLELRLNGAIQNLFNQQNILNQYYRSQQNQAGVFTINKIQNNSLRLTPNFSVEVLF